MWKLLERMKEDDHDPWLSVGDFNQVLHALDKEGARGIDYELMSNFKASLDRCGLRELPFVGHRFTWDNGREGDDFI